MLIKGIHLLTHAKYVSVIKALCFFQIVSLGFFSARARLINLLSKSSHSFVHLDILRRLAMKLQILVIYLHLLNVIIGLAQVIICFLQFFLVLG